MDDLEVNRAERVKLWVAGALVALGVLLALLPRDWIEETFGFEPDAGNGFVELLTFLVPIALGGC